MILGKELSEGVFAPLNIDGRVLDYVNEFKYLGVNLINNNGLSFSAIPEILSFHRASNAILHGRMRPKNEVLLKLLYTNCVTIFTYACATKVFSTAEMLRCHVSVNNAIRRIYSYQYYDSVRHLRDSRGLQSLYEIFYRSTSEFDKASLNSSNQVVRFIANCDLN